MTEADWLNCSDPSRMWAVVRDKASDRKLRLFAVACCRLFWAELDVHATRIAIETNELHADDRASESELRRVRSEAHTAAWQARFELRSVPLPPDGRVISQSLVERSGVSEDHLRRMYFVAFMANVSSRLRADALPMLRTDSVLAHSGPGLLRDIFGNLFHPVAFDPSWRTSTAVILARQMYDARDFDLMPVLADALEEAGCDAAELLAHCRDPQQVHVRGCWAVDLVLGKA